MKKLTRRKVTAAGIIAGAIVVSSGTAGCVFSPDSNEVENVYGPPSQFEQEENIPEAVYGPPEWFETEDNELEDVYGPPEYFE